MTNRTNDFGVDVVAIDCYRKTRLAIQCKRHNRHSTVGVNAVMQVVAGMQYYRCCSAAVMTTAAGFTKQAKELAKVYNVELFDRSRLGSEYWLPRTLPADYLSTFDDATCASQLEDRMRAS